MPSQSAGKRNGQAKFYIKQVACLATWRTAESSSFRESSTDGILPSFLSFLFLIEDVVSWLAFNQYKIVGHNSQDKELKVYAC